MFAWTDILIDWYAINEMIKDQISPDLTKGFTCLE
ncbi:hypothetical protein ATK78_2704 [Pedobacter metabolipauper]|uniref:Uncharacterized protein n=1 Tax=Pedobacter metabolipauper TaxID=425513 RepID=A0A4R6ST66_9SPHI|nr:hypothetical protein ATK78_2704 [Pedobacter metabolipauper]